MNSRNPTRRVLLQAAAAGAVAAAAQSPAGTLTTFQTACMTLPYSAFPLQRALEGIASAGYRYVAWGTTHQEDGKTTPVMDAEASPAAARELGRRCRDLGLEPVMMFAVGYVEAPDALKAHTRRIEQAAAAGLPFVLSFGHTQRDSREVWIRNLNQIAPIARAAGVTVVIKQHGGTSANGSKCISVLREVTDEGVRMCYDAGNNLWYDNNDPIADIQNCRDYIRAFCIKDLRLTPKREGCGPGLGEIDHYKLLMAVARTGRMMPLACETLWAPLLPRPKRPEDIDALARRAREFLELVTGGIQA